MVCGETLDEDDECRTCKMQESLDEAEYNKDCVDKVNK